MSLSCWLPLTNSIRCRPFLSWFPSSVATLSGVKGAEKSTFFHWSYRKKMSERKKPTPLTVCVEDDVKRELETFKQQTGLSVSWLLRQGVFLALEKYRPMLAQPSATR